ncbi:MAG TPA: hypothetical protein PLS90_12485 [Candidatus Sumerlaeota bacterium]|nr:hypothetical protein [Candidatus Sumerlaeota bacterium]
MAKQRNPLITVDGRRWRRIPIRTHRVTREDDIVELCDRYSRELRQAGDILFVSEKVVAVTQGRAIPVSEIRIGLLARLLWRCVRKVPYGVGLRSPETMQCAINECGAARILAAAAIGGLTRAFGRRGDFYRIAGMQAATIDAAGTSPLQSDCVILGPKDPDDVARRLRARTGLAAAVVDVNDIGGSWVLGSDGIADPRLIEAILKDNPLGQKDEQTPFGLIRAEAAEAAPPAGPVG